MSRVGTWVVVVVAVAALGACGDDEGAQEAATTTTTTEAPTTTTTTPTIRCEMNVGEPHDMPRECWPRMVVDIASDRGALLDEDEAERQAQMVCRRYDTDPDSAALTILADWTTGAVPISTDDHAGVLIASVAVYCPEWWDMLPSA